MSTEEPRYLSQTVDYLGFLYTKVHDLQGIANLTYELIQNADDVKDEQGRPGATRITFDVREDALIVENDGVFRDTDFARMQNVASGGKRREVGTTGAFGVGFIAVYQITDHPEVLSSGRHWIIRPEAPGDKRIEERQAQTEGTRFRLPWAFDHDSEVRRELGLDVVRPEELPRFRREIGAALSLAALFLNQLTVLELKHSGTLVKRFIRQDDGDAVLIQQGSRVVIWNLLRGSFASDAEQLRSAHPHIEPKRGSEVLVAVPDELPDSGRLFAVLPSETIMPLPFHINADFYPRSDRKNIMLGDDYQSEWNRAAIRAAARALATDFDRLPGLLGHEGLWKLLERVDACRQQVEHDQLDRAFAAFWDEIAPTLSSRSIVFTAQERWVQPANARLLETEAEQAASSILEALDIHVVHPDIRPYFALMRRGEIGTALLTVHDIVGALETAGVDTGSPIDQAPDCLRSKEQWHTLWEALDALMDRRQTYEARMQAEQALERCAIALDAEDVLRPPARLFRASPRTRQLFPEVDWLKRYGHSEKIPNCLVPEFGAAEAVELLSQRPEARFEADWESDALDVEALYLWFESRKRELLPDPDLIDALRNLSIWPSSGGLASLTDLYIPGGFDDPLKLAQLVDLEGLGGRREFLEDLGVKVLTFDTYVREQVPRVLEEEVELSPDARKRLVQLLAQKLGEMQGDEDLRERLSRLRMIECTDGSFRSACEVYARSRVVSELLGDQVHVAASVAENADAIRALYDWLGVAQDPRPEDVIERVQETTGEPPQDETVNLVEAVFEYLVDRWPRWEEDERNRYQDLRQCEWLPGIGGAVRWYRPDEVFATFRAYLFETQAVFLRIPRPLQDRGGGATGLIAFLGINRDPTPELVVRHLLHCSKHHEPVNRELYRFLNDNVDNAAIAKLRDKACLYLANGEYVRPDQVYWSEHPFGPFRYQLDPQLRQYSELFDRLGVRDRPVPTDAVKVLLEIGEKHRGSLDDQTMGVLMGCWEQLSTALEEERIEREALEQLRSERVIPDPTAELNVPEHMFFEDRPGLKHRFPVLLDRNVIKRPQGAWRAMEAAGVQRLSQAVDLHLLECEDPTDHQVLHERVSNRRGLLARVVESEKASGVEGLIPKALDRLRFRRARTLTIQYTFHGFHRNDAAEPESVPAQLLRDEGVLIAVHADSQVPWIPVARELAYAIKPLGDVGGLAMGIKEILSAQSLEEAQGTLDELGYPRVQEKIGVEIETSATVDVGEEGTPPEEAVKGIIGPDGADRTRMPEGPPEKPAGMPSADGTRKPSRKQKPQGKLRTYVVPEGFTAEGRPDSDSAKDRLLVDKAGVERVLEYERSQDRKAVEMEHHNEGFDVKSEDGGGEERYIEVKSLSGDWGARNAAGLTRAQFDFAREKGDQFWLYVVERATSDTFQIHRIWNPADQVNQYLFDDGWQQVARDE